MTICSLYPKGDFFCNNRVVSVSFPVKKTLSFQLQKVLLRILFLKP